MSTQGQRARAPAEQEAKERQQARLAAIQAYRLANPHIMHTLDGLTTSAASIDFKYNKKKDAYRIVSSDRVLFLVSEDLLGESSSFPVVINTPSEVLWQRAQTVVEEEIRLSDPKLETAEYIRALFRLVDEDCDARTIVGPLSYPYDVTLVPSMMDLIDKYKFGREAFGECALWMHENND